jgi:hypothetical protein
MPETPCNESLEDLFVKYFKKINNEKNIDEKVENALRDIFKDDAPVKHIFDVTSEDIEDLIK